MTTVPRIGIVSNTVRIALVAASSASFLLPRPIQRADASAAASVTRTSSIVKLLSTVVTLSSLHLLLYAIHLYVLLLLPLVHAHKSSHRASLTFLSFFHSRV